MRILPVGTCDTHSHIYGDISAYALRAGHRHEPDGLIANYLSTCNKLGVDRHVIVQGKAYPDSRCTLNAVSALGLERARAILFPDETLLASDLRQLNASGVRGWRFLSPTGNKLDMAAIKEAAEVAAKMGWHIIVQADAGELMLAFDRLLSLPCPVVVDHIGRLPYTTTLCSSEYLALVDFLRGGGWVKLAAPYNLVPNKRSSFQPLSSIITGIIQAAPRRCIWGINAPHPNLDQDEKPDETRTVKSLLNIVGEPWQRKCLFVNNAAQLYEWSPLN